MVPAQLASFMALLGRLAGDELRPNMCPREHANDDNASGSHLFSLGEGQQRHQFADLDLLQRTHGSFDFSA